MGTWADVLTAWQKAVFAVIYDVCMIAVMVGIEVLGHATSSPVARMTKREDAAIDITPTIIVDKQDPPEPAEPVISLQPKPRLVAEGKSRTKGVAAYLAERLQPRRGARVELEECQAAYAASGMRPITAQEFVESLQHFCGACRIKTKVIGDRVYLMDVQLAPAQGRETSQA
jgi:hypothetical protein